MQKRRLAAGGRPVTLRATEPAVQRIPAPGAPSLSPPPRLLWPCAGRKQISDQAQCLRLVTGQGCRTQEPRVLVLAELIGKEGQVFSQVPRSRIWLPGPPRTCRPSPHCTAQRPLLRLPGAGRDMRLPTAMVLLLQLSLWPPCQALQGLPAEPTGSRQGATPALPYLCPTAHNGQPAHGLRTALR